MKTAIVLLTALMMLPAYANDSAEVKADSAEVKAVAAEAPKAAENGEKMICEKRKIKGSNRVERVCMTEAERIAAKDKAQEALHRLGRCSGNDNSCVSTPL